MLIFLAGEERSTALLSLTAFLALVDCTSSVVYLPYMAYFKDGYLSGFYIGQLTPILVELLTNYYDLFLGLQVKASAVCSRVSWVLLKASVANLTA